MPTIQASLKDPTGAPFTGTIKVSRHYPRLASDGISYVPMEVSRAIGVGGSVSFSLAEGMHSFALYPSGTSVPSVFFEAYVPKAEGPYELLELYTPYGLNKDEVAKPYDQSLIDLVDAYRSAQVGQVPSKVANGYQFITPTASGPGSASWAGLTGQPTDSTSLMTLLGNYATVGVLGNYATTSALNTGISGRQPLSTELTGVATLGTTGVLKRTGPGAYSASSLVASDIPDLSTIYQPLDADLTAIAALSTQSYGRGLLTQTSVATAQTYLSLGSTDSPQFASVAIRGTGGAGWLQLNGQSATPATPAAGSLRLYRGSTGALSWVQPDGLERSLLVPTITSNRQWTLPDTSGDLLVAQANPQLGAIESGFAAAPNGAVLTKSGSVLVYASPGASSGSLQLYRGSAQDLAVTGTTTEVELATITIPGGTLQAIGDHMEVITYWALTGSTNTKTVRVRINGTAVVSVNVVTASQVTVAALRRLFWQDANTLLTVPPANASSDGVFGASLSVTADLSQPLVLSFTGQLALATENITLRTHLVRVYS